MPTELQDTSQPISTTPARARLRLFLVSFVILFFELACIRWFASSVIFLTFFTNIVLMACFLGMSIGCLSATGRRDFTRWVLPIMLLAVVLAWLSLSLYQSHTRMSVNIGGQASPQQIFFGTEYRANDPSQIVIPIEAIAGVFFVLIALIFVGLGQIMGRAFNAIPDRVAAYTSDIAGSFTGIVAFGLLSYCRLPPIVWFTISIAIFFYLKRADEQALASVADAGVPRRNLVQTGLQIAATVGVLFLVGAPGVVARSDKQTFWSPYYKIDYLPAPAYVINTNNIGHQEMRSIAKNGPAYALPHLLNRDAGEKPFLDVLIIGAGSGNDVQAARYFGVANIDAVEIDPVIQSLGQQYHPDRPYDDPRVRVHLDDGRSFVKKSQKKYDLVIYALVDSLVLQSGYSSLRLESFLFTRQAFEDIKAKLKPDGMFAMYNFYRQGWVVTRLTKLAGEVFGAPPLVFSLPYRERIAPEAAQHGHYTFILCGNTRKIREAFNRDKYFWLNSVPAFNRDINAFGTRPPVAAAQQRLPGSPQAAWERVGPAQVDTSTTTLLPSDNWPFLYLRERAIPALNVHGMILIALLSLGLLFLIVPVRRGTQQKDGGIAPAGKPFWKIANWQMFFLGAGFMLLETKSVVHMALLFGSTWIVNSFVFAAILLMILVSNLWVIKARPQRLAPYYVLMIAALLLGAIVPMNTFLALPGISKVIASCAITFLPIFFAGVVFAASFRDSEQPDIDFGSNIAGIILGGLCEFSSLAVGFNGLLVIAIIFYALSAVLRPRRQSTRVLPM